MVKVKKEKENVINLTIDKLNIYILFLMKIYLLSKLWIKVFGFYILLYLNSTGTGPFTCWDLEDRPLVTTTRVIIKLVRWFCKVWTACTRDLTRHP